VRAKGREDVFATQIKNGSASASTACPLYPREQTSASYTLMTALRQQRSRNGRFRRASSPVCVAMAFGG
jgi:hypothetical protein